MPFRAIAAALRRDNRQLFTKLAVVVALMFGFGYAMVPLYKSICEALGIPPEWAQRCEDSAHVGHARGPWDFKPAVRHMTVHPGELSQVMYEFRNVQNRTMAAQAIPSYAPMQATPYFNKLECFCFNEYTLKPGESKRWPVVFVIDPKLPKDVKTITLSYTFFEVGGTTPPAPVGQVEAAPAAAKPHA